MGINGGLKRVKVVFVREEQTILNYGWDRNYLDQPWIDQRERLEAVGALGNLQHIFRKEETALPLCFPGVV